MTHTRARLRARAAVFVACAIGVTGACTEAIVPTTVNINSTQVDFDALGETFQLSGTVLDQNGAQILDGSITFTSANDGVATVSAGGLIAATGVGSTNVTASGGGSASVTIAVSVTQVPAAVVKVSGDVQTGNAGEQLANPIIARVNDSRGNGIAGVALTFSVTQGGGSITTENATTGSDGQASTTWTTGNTAGPNLAQANGGAAGSVNFSATGAAGPPTIVAVNAGDNQSALTGTAVAILPSVVVRDQFNNVKSGASVTFAVASGGGSVTGASPTTDVNGVATVGSWTMGAGGSNTMTATVTGTGITDNPVTFTATSQLPGTPTSIAVSAGNGQTGLVGFATNLRPAVIVRDGANSPVPGVSVTFAIATGGGSVGGGSAVTNVQGIATIGSWTLGGTPGANSLTATATGTGISGNPLMFNATGVNSTFNIDIRFIGTPTASQQTAFTNAAARWQQLIIGDLPLQSVLFGGGQCGGVTNAPAVNETLDVLDLIIFASIGPIDGVGNTVGSAGPCLLRSTTHPYLGGMIFDVADVAQMETQGVFSDVVLHEMGHVLGFGTLWNPGFFNLLRDPSLAGNPDPYFVGVQARRVFDEIGGTSYTGGQKVPVHNADGGGSADGHWREGVFGNELMSPFISGPGNPLSVLTVAAQWDENYQVNIAGADAYTRTFSIQAAMQTVPGQGRVFDLRNDIATGPIFVTDRAGKIISVRR